MNLSSVPPTVIVWGSIIVFGLGVLTKLSAGLLKLLGPWGKRIRDMRINRASQRAGRIEQLERDIAELQERDRKREAEYSRHMARWHTWAVEVSGALAKARITVSEPPWEFQSFDRNEK